MFPGRPPSSALIVSDSLKITEGLQQLLSQAQFEPVVTAGNTGEAKRMLVDNSYNIVIINTPLPDEFGLQFALECTERNGCGVLLLVRAERFEQVSYKAEQFGILTLQRPTPPGMIMQSLHLLVASQARLNVMAKKAQTLESKMDEMKLVSRAKLLLMTTLGMSEKDAHRYIEKQAMDTCAKRREVAENIIRTYQK